jgi:hypothetical protein
MFFGSKNVSYLGFRSAEEGHIPGKDKLRAVARAEPPELVQEIRHFLAFANFTLMTDHKPLVALGKIHKRALSRLQTTTTFYGEESNLDMTRAEWSSSYLQHQFKK